MNVLRHPVLMLFAGALAGFLSGLQAPLIAGLRGALFGFCLSLMALIVNHKGWKPYAILPALLLGTILGFFPLTFMDGLGEAPFQYDYRTLIYAVIFLPLYGLPYTSKKLYLRIILMLVTGLIASAARTQIIGWSWHLFKYTGATFIQGALPFSLLWLGAMQITDPRFISQPAPLPEEDPS